MAILTPVSSYTTKDYHYTVVETYKVLNFWL